MMRATAGSPPPRPAGLLSWLPLILLCLVAMALWFVTTFVVLLPLLIPGIGAVDATPDPGLAQAVAVLMLVLFLLLFPC